MMAVPFVGGSTPFPTFLVAFNTAVPVGGIADTGANLDETNIADLRNVRGNLSWLTDAYGDDVPRRWVLVSLNLGVAATLMQVRTGSRRIFRTNALPAGASLSMSVPLTLEEVLNLRLIVNTASNMDAVVGLHPIPNSPPGV